MTVEPHDQTPTGDVPRASPNAVFTAGIVTGDTVAERYRILEPLGAGGMGTVFRAQQTHPIKRLVALKLIKPGMDSKAVLARFEAERQALALMDHPNVAKVYDGGVTNMGRPFFAMELVKGLPITDHCDRHKLDLAERLNLFMNICDAVQHAHSKGVIHRDLKPANILVEYERSTATPKIIDFGVAKALNQPLTESTLFTAQGQLVGTPEYMSPEQAEMTNQDIDTRADVYSLGVVLYELLTGYRPFEPEALRTAGIAEIQRIIREIDPPKPSTRLSDLSNNNADPELTARIAGARRTEIRSLTGTLKRDLDWVVMKCLEKDRERRYDTPSALADELRRYLNNEPVNAGPPSAAYRIAKFTERHRAAVVAFATITLILTAAVVVTSAAAVVANNAESELRLTLRDLDDALTAEQDQRRIAERNATIAEELAEREAEARLRAGMTAARSELSRARVLCEVGRAGEAISILSQVTQDIPEHEWRWTAWHVARAARLRVLITRPDPEAPGFVQESMRTSVVDAWFIDDASKVTTSNYWDRRPSFEHTLAVPGFLPTDATPDEFSTVTPTQGSASAPRLRYEHPDPDRPITVVTFSEAQRITELRVMEEDRSIQTYTPRDDIRPGNIWIDWDEPLFALASTSGKIIVHQFGTSFPTLITELQGIGRNVEAVHVNPANNTATAIGEDWSWYQMDLRPNADTRTVPRWIDESFSNTTTRRLAYSKDGDTLFAGSYEGFIARFDATALSPDPETAPKPAWTARHFPDQWHALAYLQGELDLSPDEQLLAISTGRSELRILSATSGDTIAVVPTASFAPRAQFIDNDRLIMSNGRDDVSLVTSSGRVIRKLLDQLDNKFVYDIAFDHASNRIAFINDNRAQTPEGEVVVSTIEGDTIRELWRRPLDSRGRSAVFSPDGATLATSERGGTAVLWNAADGAHVLTLNPLTAQSHRSIVSGIAFHPTDPVVATASHDDTIRFWSTTSGLLLAEIELSDSAAYNTGRLKHLTFRPDAKELAVAFEDTILLIDLTHHDRAIADLAALRNTTPLR